jgi:hypothetical protein
MNFKLFLENTEEYQKDLKNVLKNIPKSHAALIKGYEIKFEPTNTLKNDSNHIGFIDEENKKIRIAAPWNYSRCFTFLHEIAHAVYKYKLNKNLRKEWADIIKSTKKDQKKSLSKKCHSSLNQNSEELFCMAYASFYSRHVVSTYDNKSWKKFIEKIPN